MGKGAQHYCRDRYAVVHRLREPANGAKGWVTRQPSTRNEANCASPWVAGSSATAAAKRAAPRSTAREAVLVNTAGGIAGGDRFAVDLDLGAGSRLTVTTAAAEKVYRSLGPAARLDVTARLGEDAELIWLPHETIVFDCAQRCGVRTAVIHLRPSNLPCGESCL